MRNFDVISNSLSTRVSAEQPTYSLIQIPPVKLHHDPVPLIYVVSSPKLQALGTAAPSGTNLPCPWLFRVLDNKHSAPTNSRQKGYIS